MELSKIKNSVSSDKKSELLVKIDQSDSKNNSIYGKQLTVWQCTKIVFKEFYPMYFAIGFDVSSYIAVAYFVGNYSGEQYYLGGVGLGSITNNFVLRSYVIGFNN